MRVCTATLKSVSPYSQSRQHDTPHLEKEGHDDYERRTWREKAHYNEETRELFIPPMAFKMCVDETAKYLGLQIPGKGKATYAKHFLSGTLVMDQLPLGITVDAVDGEWINANSDGVRGSGKRVKRCFPVVPSWSGSLDFYILDDTITPKVFEHVLGEAGRFKGIGRFRPANGGFYGRFEVTASKWRNE